MMKPKKKKKIKIELTGKINNLGGLWKSEKELERNCTTLRKAAANKFLEKEFEKAEKRANSKKGKSKARQNNHVNNQKLEEKQISIRDKRRELFKNRLKEKIINILLIALK